MISVIICSRKSILSRELVQNIEESIGCVYELIVIDNSGNHYSIFEAYNIGIKKSIYNYLCFIHDDILFETKYWGKKIEEIFKSDSKIGLIGIAGSKSKTKSPSGWWSCPIEDKCLYLIQHSNNKLGKLENQGFEYNNREEVLVIDGVFMAMRKVNLIKFHEDLFGFHNYDINISLEYYKKGYIIIVTNEILIQHFSKGNLNKDWLTTSFKIHELYSQLLPIGLSNNSKNFNYECNNLISFIIECLKYKDIKLAFIIWLRLIRLKPFSKYHFKFLFSLFIKY